VGFSEVTGMKPPRGQNPFGGFFIPIHDKVTLLVKKKKGGKL